MSRTFEDIRKLLAQKFQVESHRLKSWGTPTDEKSAISFADSVARYVQSLMADSRYRELKRLKKKYGKAMPGGRCLRYIEERIRATKAMAAAIQHAAEEAERKKAWKPKSVKKEKKHHHHEHDRKHKHDKHKKSKHRSRH